MATCSVCKEQVDELTIVTVGGKKKKMCEDCADRAKESESMAEESERVVQQMMGFKGRR